MTTITMAMTLRTTLSADIDKGLCRDKDGRTRKFLYDKDSLNDHRIEFLSGSALNSGVFHLPFPDHVHHFGSR